MKFNKDEILELAKQIIQDNEMTIFIQDVIALLPCSMSTFYSMYPENSEGLDILKGMLVVNRVNVKMKMRAKWEKSESPALQMALYKLMSDTEELKKLAMQYVESENTNHNKGKTVIEFKNFGKQDNDSGKV